MIYIFISICAKFAQKNWNETRKEKWMNTFRHLIVEINRNRLIAFNKLPTFGKIYMGCFIVRSIGMFEVAHQGSNRILRGRNEVNRFHGCEWLPTFVQIFHHYWIDFRQIIYYSDFGSLMESETLSMTVQCALTTDCVWPEFGHPQFVHDSKIDSMYCKYNLIGIECGLLTSNAFGTDGMHFATSRYHSHCQFVDNQNAPFKITRLRCIFGSL